MEELDSEGGLEERGTRNGHGVEADSGEDWGMSILLENLQSMRLGYRIALGDIAHSDKRRQPDYWQSNYRLGRDV